MPKYQINIELNGQVGVDDEGAELANEDEAKSLAKASLLDNAKAFMAIGTDVVISATIKDGSGALVSIERLAVKCTLL